MSVSSEHSANAPKFIERTAEQLSLPRRGVAAVIELLGGGATVPFIARYRKERTGGLDEVQIRAVRDRHAYLEQLEQRRHSVLEAIREQGKLTPDLERKLLACTSKTELEDIYLPFRPKRKTRASVARSRGLQPLADLIAAQGDEPNPDIAAARLVSAEHDVPDVDAALAGARDIVAEDFAVDAAVRARTRERIARRGVLAATKRRKAGQQAEKYRQYFDYREPLASIPSHRYLALHRGERDSALKVSVELDEKPLLAELLELRGARPGSSWYRELQRAIEDGYHRLLFPALVKQARREIKQRSDVAAVDVFAENLRNLLLAPPLGGKPVVSVDPGLRTGCKCAALGATGSLLATATIYPHTSERKVEQAASELRELVTRHGAAAVAVGNGTAGRETAAFARQVLADAGAEPPPVVLVNEAGASVYSASPLAREEFPELDVSLRGAVSIGRRLQDPLSELVKIEPKSIGVGQYQHDVNQQLLQQKLDEVVESCVNGVGVELNTASVPLLARVAGIGPTIATAIVGHRDGHGPFESREQLRSVSGVGPRTFEQAAGFLRIRDGSHPLDRSAVHPERYALVTRIARDLGVSLGQLVGHEKLAARIDIQRYLDDETGEPTLRDIVTELAKPGRDPRDTFAPPRFRSDVSKIDDLKQGMQLEGVVSNVTAFGAFVDVGVHQDGLVHISELADRFVRDPHDVVKVGDRLTVRVLAVDLERQRISLSARSSREQDGSSAESPRAAKPTRGDRRSDGRRNNSPGDPGRRRPRDPHRRRDQGRPRRGQSSPRKTQSSFKHTPFADLLKKKDED